MDAAQSAAEKLEAIDMQILKMKESIIDLRRLHMLERLRRKEQKKVDVEARKKVREEIRERWAEKRRERMREKGRHRREKKNEEKMKAKAAARALKDMLPKKRKYTRRAKKTDGQESGQATPL